MNLSYRKATQCDIDAIATIVSSTLGTCDVRKPHTGKTVSDKVIFNRNKKQITEDISNYFVCCDNSQVVGACGISEPIKAIPYNIDNLMKYREILYLVVDSGYQKKGIGTTLLKLCCEKIDSPIVYEAWGERSINSKILLERCGFVFAKDLGQDYYKNHGYCPFCCNRNTNCTSCCAEVWIKQKD